MDTDSVAVDEDPPAAEGLGARVVEGVQQLAVEAVQPVGDLGRVEASGRDDHPSNVSPLTDQPRSTLVTGVAKRMWSRTPIVCA